MHIRKTLFAGSWYPADATSCEWEINKFLKEDSHFGTDENACIGGIVPHAGWFYSGAIACQVIRRLALKPPPDVILIFGMHLASGSPNYIMTNGAWETPFGDLVIDSDLARELTKRFAFQVETTTEFKSDNTIELQLPFIKYFFNSVKIVPIGVPPDHSSIELAKSAADAATRLGLQVRVIGSTDLTHYGRNYGFMPKGTGSSAVDWVRDKNDRQVIDAILAMDPEKVLTNAAANNNACCAGAAASAIAVAQSLGAETSRTVAYATSYDKSPGDSLVGYVGIVFS
ncbi:MAG: AmmeMemoRadiSam system protein B [Deltaproteobacteria bacterium]|nr:AmmeMemoRadiSam system protein B [Deltaproteobacteria bacterium]